MKMGVVCYELLLFLFFLVLIRRDENLLIRTSERMNDESIWIECCPVELLAP